MGFLRRYLKSRLPVFAALAGFIAIFAAVFWLSRLPIRAVEYPALICAFIGCAALALDFIIERRKHMELCRLASVPASLIDSMPRPTGALEADYQSIVEALRRENVETRDRAAARYRDTVDYYTVWAHQIKTPITAMRLTLEREDTPTSRKLMADVLEIERYVGMVMAYLRLDSDESDYVFREYALDAILRGCVAEYASEFIDRGLTLDLRETGLAVVTDSKWLGFVLGQILSNALKYTREGGISIYMEAPATLCVADTGVGIDPADLPRVFERGYTGLNGRRDARASGLGLYLVKRVCEKLGVGVSISSTPGEGTTVRLDLEQYALRAE